VGEESGLAMTTANQNVGIGSGTLMSCTTGSENTCVGGGEQGNNNAAGQAITVGSRNTLIGRRAGSSIQDGSNNVCLGVNAGRGQIISGNQQLYIARDNIGHGNAQVWIYGNSSGSCFQGDNTQNWSTTSDQRLKKDIVTNTVGLSIINNVTVRNFKYKQYSDGSPVTTDDTVDMSEFPDADNLNQVLIGQGKTETQIGIIAQELETIAPNCVSTSDRGVKTVVTDELFWHMLNAIKELSAKVTALEAG